MKTLLVSALLALSFTTGFTCSKNAPEATAPAEATAPVDAAAPQATAEAAPAPTEASATVSAPTETK